jgi:serine/threonine protein kinase
MNAEKVSVGYSGLVQFFPPLNVTLEDVISTLSKSSIAKYEFITEIDRSRTKVAILVEKRRLNGCQKVFLDVLTNAVDEGDVRNDLHREIVAHLHFRKIQKMAKSKEESDPLSHVCVCKPINNHGFLGFLSPQMKSNANSKIKILTEKQRDQVARNIGLAIDEVHKQGFYHRDIKLDNILIDDVTAKLSDFGKAFPIQETPPQTDHFVPIIPPEYPIHNELSEVYQFGIVLYQLYTKCPMHELALNNNPNSWNDMDKIEPAKRAFIIRMVEQNPHNRPSLSEVNHFLSKL